MSRHVLSTCLLLTLGLTTAARTSADEPPAKATSAASERQRLLREREELLAEARQHERNGKLDDAIAVAEEVLALDRQLHGDIHESVAASLEYLAALLHKHDRLAAAQNARIESFAIRAKLTGPVATAQPPSVSKNSPIDPKSTPLTIDDERRLQEAARHWAAAEKLRGDGRIDEAAEAVEKVLVIERLLFGVGDSRQVMPLELLTELHLERDDLVAARKSAQELFAICTKVHGDANWHTIDAHLLLSDVESREKLAAGQRARIVDATRLDRQSLQLHKKGRFTEAVTPTEEALEIRRTILGDAHQDVAASLGTLGLLYYEQGKYSRALPHWQRALEIVEKLRGPSHPATATVLNNLAMLYKSSGNHVQATQFCVRALDVREKILGPDHPETGNSVNNLAALKEYLGAYGEALPLRQRALAIFEESYGSDHPDSVTCLNNLAATFKSLGDYAKATQLFKRALGLSERVMGPSHPSTAVSLNNLALLYLDQGDYAKAEPMCQRAVEIYAQSLGPHHPSTAAIVHNLALLHQVQGNYAQAKRLYQQVVAINETAFGPAHPGTANSLSNLAAVFEAEEDFERALPLQERSLEIRERALGPSHPDTAHSLNNLAALLKSQGNYARALPLYERALAIAEASLGPQHIDTARCLNNLAALYKSQGNLARALPLQERALTIARGLLALSADVQSENQQLILATKLRFFLDAYLTSLLESGGDAEVAYTALLASKGAVTSRQRGARLARSIKAPELAQILENLRSTTGRLATLASSSRSPRQATSTLEEIIALSHKKEELESELSSRSAEFRRENSQREQSAATCQANLPSGVALLDFIEYRRSSLPPEGKGRLRYARHMAAFVVLREQPIQWFDLGPADAIAEAVDGWRSDLGVNRDPGTKLRQLVWKPLESRLDGAKSVLISPDGALARFPFAALPGRKPGTFLVEDVALAIVPVPQMLPELLAPDASIDGESALPSLLLVGDVDFGAPPGAPIELAKTRSAPRGTSDTARISWQPLAGTGPETVAVRESFLRGVRDGHVDYLQAALATEAAFRERAPKHRFLHLATHGFFAPPHLRSALKVDHSLREWNSDLRSESSTLVGFHPGLLSGLVLAGANRPVDPDQDDGILTALEVAELNLSGVELATLSACETGLGQSAGGEGLLGLQRAFQVAGARATIASLWQVPDQATRTLMTRFYENLWQKKLPKLEALREAQIWMLREGVKQPELWRGAGETVPFVKPTTAESSQRLPPRYWAAFVLSGDWR